MCAGWLRKTIAKALSMGVVGLCSNAQTEAVRIYAATAAAGLALRTYAPTAACPINWSSGYINNCYAYCLFGLQLVPPRVAMFGVMRGEGAVMLSYNSTHTFCITNPPCTCILLPTP